MIYRIEVRAKPGFNDARCAAIAADIQTLGISAPVAVEIADLYFLGGALDDSDASRIAEQLLCDPVTQTYAPGASPQPAGAHIVEVVLRPGVTDAVADELVRAARELGVNGIERAATGARYTLHGALDAEQVTRIARRLLANEVIQTFSIDAPIQPYLDYTASENPHIEVIPIRGADDDALMRLSRERRLALNPEEMRAIRDYFIEIGRDPTDAEIETLAQTWSEHCVHKTFKAKIEIRDSRLEIEGAQSPISNLQSPIVDGLLKTYIKRATDEIAAPWVKSAFVDNAGVIAFDDEFDLAFKAETHNHPSAIEPFGGANTGVGGVIRDIIAVSARPIANTDVLCFGPQDLPFDALPEGVLHPRRVRAGVIAGIEDYGNKMGIPTVSGAIVYDEGYIANPLVYCGCVGIAPVNSHPRAPQAGDRIVVLGGRTGRDGLRGATFSSAALTAETSDVAGSSVQIGNPIVEKNVMEVVMAARDARLYHAITDCGAGGLSSAVGEMGATLGARVQLERVPLKYAGLAPWEIWLSEAQERMVLAVPQQNLTALQAICERFDCEMSDIGEFTGDGHLRVYYRDLCACDLDMRFLHDGLPRRVLRAVVGGRGDVETRGQEDGRTGRQGDKETRGKGDGGASRPVDLSLSQLVARMMAHPNVASKEDVIRVYDHEVQGGTVIKPLVGIGKHGPSDAVVIKPQGTRGLRGFALACGINPNIGKRDAYAMAVSIVDEAIRNLVCVGADPSRIALLDNFCWGDPNDPVELGALVEACRGCYDAALHYRAPFISGKDSLNNTYLDKHGRRAGIPATLLISAIGIVDDVTKCVTMDLKAAGDRLYLLGETKDELAGSLYEQIVGRDASCRVSATTPPTLPSHAPALYAALHRAMQAGLVRAAHDCSEGGLAVALVEMAQAGGLGIELEGIGDWRLEIALFSESNGRIVVEVAPEHAPAFEAMLHGLPWAIIGVTTESPGVRLPDGTPLVDD
ncbi:MAG: phosphoribosylformylglycinamidine synthase subunit PurL [Anaerolineae bacterium]|nr:phosphoribosylformylglycinamidine synthase subunit PurL [Candidatus Roseilinea sp.]MDW8451149.1 phosphoribosylformylglycinamidine synthase subunit PurL [Anaerolineae bacterium]